MTLNEYQVHNKNTYLPHTELSAEQARLLNWVIGLTGETGELTELIKHAIFYKQPADKIKYAKELGDILWYLGAIADSLEIRLQDVLDLNTAKLDHRYKGHFNIEGSIQRHEREHAFEETTTYLRLKDKITGTEVI